MIYIAKNRKSKEFNFVELSIADYDHRFEKYSPSILTIYPRPFADLAAAQDYLDSVKDDPDADLRIYDTENRLTPKLIAELRSLGPFNKVLSRVRRFDIDSYYYKDHISDKLYVWLILLNYYDGCPEVTLAARNDPDNLADSYRDDPDYLEDGFDRLHDWWYNELTTVHSATSIPEPVSVSC